MDNPGTVVRELEELGHDAAVAAFRRVLRAQHAVAVLKRFMQEFAVDLAHGEKVQLPALYAAQEPFSFFIKSSSFLSGANSGA